MDELSIALIDNPDVRNRTNIHLKGAGLRLDAFEREGKTSLRLMNTHTENDTGILLAPSPVSKPTGDLWNNRIGAWFNADNFLDENDNAAGRRMLAVVARAEGKAHEETQGRFKPDRDAALLDGLNGTLKGRLASSPWYQEGTREDGTIPEPRAVQVIQMSQRTNIKGPDGAYVRIEKDDHLGRDTQGALMSVSADSAMGVLDVDKSDSLVSIDRRAERAVEAMKILKESGSDFAVVKERNDQASIVCQTQDGAIRTLKTYGWAEAAEMAIERDGEQLKRQKDRHESTIAGIRRVKDAFSR